MIKFLKEHSLSLALVTVLVTMMTFQFFIGYTEWVGEQVDHDAAVYSKWSWDYIRFYMSESVLSLEADVFGALILVLFSKWLFERGSAESTNQ